MGQRLVEGNVGFVHLVVEVVLENAVGVPGIPFLGELLDLFGQGALVCAREV